MDEKEILVERILKLLNRDVRLPGQATEVGNLLFEFEFKFSKTEKFMKLKNLYESKLSEWGFEDLIDRQASYAIRLARSGGGLEYEEMHKLFSLADTVNSLQEIGFVLGEVKKNSLAEALKERFDNEPKLAKIVAKDKLESWNKDFWWYKENL